MNPSSSRAAYERERRRDAARDATPLVGPFALVLLAAETGPGQVLLAILVGITSVVFRWPASAPNRRLSARAPRARARPPRARAQLRPPPPR